MSLTLDQKKVIVTEVAEVASVAYSAVAAEYRGMTVGDMTDLRNEARSGGVYLRVVKNTLARRAIKGTEFECMNDGLVGPLIIAFSQEDPGGAARVIEKFSKTNKKLVVKLVSLGGKLLDPADIKAVASLPTKDQAIAQLMSVMKAPVVKLVQTMNEVPTKLVRVIAAVKDQKEAG
ncbi:MAG: 50S ribosomal protein L10 [Gammaproteobacteria bacterium]|nr:50S ribosomal protein L10 [Gammaproteobacteria bacterium]